MPPTLSIPSLVELFNDYPTVGLVLAVCEQMQPAPVSTFNVQLAMYPRLLRPDDFELEEHEQRLIQLGFDLWKRDRKAA